MIKTSPDVRVMAYLRRRNSNSVGNHSARSAPKAKATYVHPKPAFPKAG